MFVGSFEADTNQFPLDVQAAIEQFKASGVTNLVVDVTNNGGLCTFSAKCWQSLTSAGPRWIRFPRVLPSPVPFWHCGWIPVRAPDTERECIPNRIL